MLGTDFTSEQRLSGRFALDIWEVSVSATQSQHYDEGMREKEKNCNHISESAGCFWHEHNTMQSRQKGHRNHKRVAISFLHLFHSSSPATKLRPGIVAYEINLSCLFKLYKNRQAYSCPSKEEGSNGQHWCFKWLWSSSTELLQVA